MVSEARCGTRPPPTPTFTFRVFFNFHLGIRWFTCRGAVVVAVAHVSRSDAIGDAPAIAHKARGRSAHCGALNALTFEGPFVHCVPRPRVALWHIYFRPLFMAPIVLEIRHRRRVHETRYYRGRRIAASFYFFAARPLCLQFQRIFLNTIVTSALSNVHMLLLK